LLQRFCKPLERQTAIDISHEKYSMTTDHKQPSEDDVLRRMLQTPPRPHVAKQKPKPKQRKPKQAP
jgi:hypothetical protein